MALTQVTSGLISSVSNTAISGLITSAQIASVANTQITGVMTASQIATVANTQITGTITSSQLSNTAVGAGSYGSASATPSISINAQGQITSATNTTIALGASAITSGTLPIARGGTNATCTPTAGGVAYGTGSAIGYTAAGTTGYYLKSNATGAPSWAAVCAAPPTTYGAVGTYVTAYSLVFGAAGTTVAGSCLKFSYNVNISGTCRNQCGIIGGAGSVTTLNGWAAGSCALKRVPGLQLSGCLTSSGLSGTWRAMTYVQKGSCIGNATGLNLFVRTV